MVTYDRRANSRSPRPDGWQSTSTEEQSDDAAGLIEALGIVPAAVFGTSWGAILHEPPMHAGMSNPEEVLGVLQRVVEGGMQRGGPRGGLEAFLRFAAGDETFEKLDPGLRERMLGNAEVFFGVELGVLEPYRPDDATLAGVEVPVRVMAGPESPPLVEASRWLAARLNVELETLPGPHMPYFDRPEEMAEAIRPLLRELSE